MIVVNPISWINGAFVLCVPNGLAEPSTLQGETAWSSGTTYNSGDKVIRTSTHRKYQSLIGSNINHTPETSTTQWQDIGPDNKWAFADFTRNTQSIGDVAGALSFEFDYLSISNVLGTAFTRIDTIAAMNIDADFVELKILDDVTGAVNYDVTETMFKSSVINNWYDYFYRSFSYRKNVLFNGFNPSQKQQYFVFLITSDGRYPKCGALVAGKSTYLGAAQYDARLTATNYSTIDRDTFGNAILVPRRNVPTKDITTVLPAANLDEVLAIKDTLNAIPALWAGLEDDTQTYFPAMLTFGIYTTFDFDISRIDYVDVTLELQEF